MYMTLFNVYNNGTNILLVIFYAEMVIFIREPTFGVPRA